MVSNKKRLYIALYPSGVVSNEEKRYHWAFLVGPKLEKLAKVPGVRYHAKNLPNGAWVFEEMDLRNAEQDGTCVSSAVLDWETVEATAREYAATKAGEGRFASGDMTKPKPT